MDTAIQMVQEKMDMLLNRSRRLKVPLLIARDPALLRAYEQYEKAASDYTSEINAGRPAGSR